VFAVPGEITSALSAGTNALLRFGATPLTSPDDVLEALGIEPSSQGQTRSHPLLDHLPATIDELVRKSGAPAAEIAAALAELELSGSVCEGEGVFRRS
jgi:DNA processing protein